jgi:NitT/TauT family transport system substrate-binding protein
MRLRNMLLGVVGCAVALSSSATSALAGGKLKVAHDFWIGYGAIFVADAKGFYKDEGLEVELNSFPGPGDSIVPLVSGGVDIAATTLHNIGLVVGQSDAKLKAVYMLDSSNGADAIVAKKDIADVKGLKGKKVAVTVNDVNHILLLTAIEKAGLKEEDVTVVNLAGTDAGSAFLAGTIDAATTWEPFITQCVKEGGGHVVFSTKELPQTLINVLAITEKTKTDRKADIEAFIRATAKGATYLREHPADSYAPIAKKIDAKVEDIPGMIAIDEIFDLADNKRLMTGGADAPGTKTMAKIAGFLKDRKLVQHDVDAAAIIDPSLLPKSRRTRL